MPEIHGELSGKRILLVDGEPRPRGSLSRSLRLEGSSLHVVVGATQAIAALTADRFDMIICEYWLPDMDGLSFLKLFGDCHPRTVKILSSPYMTAQAAIEAKRAGIHDVIHNPITVDMLGRALFLNRTPTVV